jgi:prepilin-type N-terminal cleavage/methylation domain-containing protein
VVNKPISPWSDRLYKFWNSPHPLNSGGRRRLQVVFCFPYRGLREISCICAGEPSKKSGFTLVELLIAAVMSVIIAGIAIGGLITAQENSRKSDRKLEQQAALQRALNYIASDVQEGVRIKLVDTPNLTTNYTPIFNIPRSNGSIAAYYSRSSSGTNWQAPIVIYRKLWPSPTDPNPSNPTTGDLDHYALIDAIANISPTNSSCQISSGFIASTPNIGFRVIAPEPSPSTAPITRATICIRGNLATTAPGGLDTMIEATVRNPSP